MVFAQIDEAAQIMKLVDTYGVSLAMLVLFCLAAAYTLRRLFHGKSGILTAYIRSTAEQQGRLAEAVASQAQTDVRMAAILESVGAKLEDIEGVVAKSVRLHESESSRFATTGLCRAFRTGCDVLEQVSDKLGIVDGTKPLIDTMRRDLDNHLAAQISRKE